MGCQDMIRCWSLPHLVHHLKIMQVQQPAHVRAIFFRRMMTFMKQSDFADDRSHSSASVSLCSGVLYFVRLSVSWLPWLWGCCVSWVLHRGLELPWHSAFRPLF